MSTFNLRLPDADLEALQALSLLTDKPMAELVREAIIEKVQNFARSNDWTRRLEQEHLDRRRAAERVMARRR